jgi:acetoin utilization protein AcuB
LAHALNQKISKYMTQPVITASPEDGARQAFFKMREHRVRHLPVVDAEDQLVGIISDRDLRRPDWVDETPNIAHVYRLDDALRVGDLMTPEPVTVRTHDRVSKAVKTLQKHRFGALPVINKEGKLVGVLSSVDLLDVLGEIVNASEQK